MKEMLAFRKPGNLELVRDRMRVMDTADVGETHRKHSENRSRLRFDPGINPPPTVSTSGESVCVKRPDRRR